MRRSQRLSEIDSSEVTVVGPDSSLQETQKTSSKRKLEEEDEDSVELPPTKIQETYIKHPVHWAPDGNLLLQIGNTRFSVHRSRLAAQSGWFKGVFSWFDLIHSRRVVPKAGFNVGDIVLGGAKAGEVVNGLDLYYLDIVHAAIKEGLAPSAEEFAALLTAMDDAIQYVHQKPSFAFVKNVFIASTYYHCDNFRKFALDIIIASFPQCAEEVPVSEIPNCVEAINLGREYDIRTILPAAFYQLARANLTTPLPSAANTGSDKSDSLKKLKCRDLVILINLQKKIALLWDDINEIVVHRCQVLRCARIHMECVNAIKKEYPLDPVIGMSKLIKHNWTAVKDCQTGSKEIVAKLKAERNLFWDKMKAWFDSEDVNSDDWENLFAGR